MRSQTLLLISPETALPVAPEFEIGDSLVWTPATGQLSPTFNLPKVVAPSAGVAQISLTDEEWKEDSVLHLIDKTDPQAWVGTVKVCPNASQYIQYFVLLDALTLLPKLNPTIVKGDCKIWNPETREFRDTTNLPIQLGSNTGVVKLVLTSEEWIPGSIIHLIDQEALPEWTGSILSWDIASSEFSEFSPLPIREKLDLCFGSCNVEEWSDLNNNRVQSEIDARIVLMYNQAVAYIHSRLDAIFAQRVDTNTLFEDLICKEAGYRLYDSKPSQAKDKAVMTQKKYVESTLVQLTNATLEVAGCIRFGSPADGNSGTKTDKGSTARAVKSPKRRTKSYSDYYK